MQNSNFLTKSKFKLACNCATKLFYSNNKNYWNQKADNSFLEALAEGGFQVGELAKLYHPFGIEIEETDYELAFSKTKELLQKEEVTIYEAAIKFNNFFVRIDILHKKGNHVNLIEVKAKSYDDDENTSMLSSKKDKINKEWEEYLYDVAFQKYVLSKAFPEFVITTELMLCDKTKMADVEGINNYFVINNGKIDKALISNEFKTDKDFDKLGKTQLLKKVKVDDLIADFVFNKEEERIPFGKIGFEEWVKKLSENTEKIIMPIGVKCKNCEFRIPKEKNIKDAKDGFVECWQNELHWSKTDFEKPSIFEIWNCRKTKKFLEEKKYFMSQIQANDLLHEGMSLNESLDEISIPVRQYLQVLKTNQKDNSIFVLKNALKNEISQWQYPLHFIDFETTRVAIPFYKNTTPYENIAFQFSHHIVYENGNIEHKGQYLNVEKNNYPNFDFLRNLKNELDKDQGSIFRYATHENTVLMDIYRKLSLQNTNKVPDKEDLMNFIKEITENNNDETIGLWCGKRNMIDLCEIVKTYYYNPYTKGSNSLKFVLPAVLNSSEYLQTKYSQAIYGSEQLKSLNFEKKTWIEKDENNTIINPYKTLPPIFDDLENSIFDNDEKLADGGAAMMAYAKLQYTNISKQEKEKIADALLRYCELDTFAMVLLWEHFKNDCI